MTRTTTFVSMARIAPANVLCDAFFHFLDGMPFRFSPFENRFVNVFGSKRPGTSNDDLVAILPFQDGARANTEFPANVHGDRNLALRRDLGSRDHHAFMLLEQ
jgi:hypothetical protein